jgi:hypothetical protein
MSDLPAHPDTNEDDPDVTAAGRTTSGGRRVAAILATVAVVALVIVLHLTGVVGG